MGTEFAGVGVVVSQGFLKADNLEIGRILHLKSEVGNLKLDYSVLSSGGSI